MTFHAFPRSEAPELLDADALPLEHLAGSLRDIVRVNRFLGDAAVEAELPDPNSPVTIIDVGTGAGDLARILAGWARIPVVLRRMMDIPFRMESTSISRRDCRIRYVAYERRGPDSVRPEHLICNNPCPSHRGRIPLLTRNPLHSKISNSDETRGMDHE